MFGRLLPLLLSQPPTRLSKEGAQLSPAQVVHRNWSHMKEEPQHLSFSKQEPLRPLPHTVTSRPLPLAKLLRSALHRSQVSSLAEQPRPTPPAPPRRSPILQTTAAKLQCAWRKGLKEKESPGIQRFRPHRTLLASHIHWQNSTNEQLPAGQLNQHSKVVKGPPFA